MKTTIYFKMGGKDRELSIDAFITHAQAMEQIVLGGLTPDDNRVLLTYSEIK